MPEVELPRDATAAFDLATDPRELGDARCGAAWPVELARTASDAWAAIREPLGSTSVVTLDAETLDELGRLGYGE